MSTNSFDLPLAASQRSFSTGLWRLADPKISLASFSAMFLGACVAAREGPLSLKWLLLTVFGIFAIEVAKNASGEVFDFDSGADSAVAPEDRSPFSGGKRVLVDRLLTRGETSGIAAACYALGIAAGLAIVFGREPRVLLLGLVGVATAFFYHAPPVKLSYRGSEKSRSASLTVLSSRAAPTSFNAGASPGKYFSPPCPWGC